MTEQLGKIKKSDKVASALTAFCALHRVFLPFVTFLPFVFLEKKPRYFLGVKWPA